MRECILAQGPARGPAGCSIMWGKPRTMPEGASQPVIARYIVVCVTCDLRCSSVLEFRQVGLRNHFMPRSPELLFLLRIEGRWYIWAYVRPTMPYRIQRLRRRNIWQLIPKIFLTSRTDFLGVDVKPSVAL